MKKSFVPRTSFRRDLRFTLEENWEMVVKNIKECQQRGVLVTPLTVFNLEGNIIGWHLHDWEPPSARIAYDGLKDREINVV